MKKLSLFTFVICFILISSCNLNTKPKDFDYGRVEDNKYINNFFDLKISLPLKGVVQSKDQMKMMGDKGKDFIAGDNENLKLILSASEINTANLISVFQYEVGSKVEFNPNFLLIAENCKGFPGIKNGSDYLFQARKLMKQSQINYDFMDEDFKKADINNQEFYLMNTRMSFGETQIKQRYYSIIKNGFSLVAIITYVNDDQKNDLEKIINSIEFKN